VRELGEDNFYLDKTGTHMETCKKCITMHVNVHEPSTLYHILEKIDIPFMPSEWENLVNRYAAGDPKKNKATSIVGRYVSKMKLAQYAGNSWADTPRLLEEHNQRLLNLKKLEDERRLQYSNATGMGPTEVMELEDTQGNVFDFGSTMTRVQKDRMIQKWGRLYKEEEWVQLEEFYNKMHETYDIQGASHEDYLKMICKTSLKMNQAIDTGDIDGFSKLSKNYDAMMRSAKFTAVQNKPEENNFISSIGEMVRLCEADGFIPRHHTYEPNDVVDLTLKDITDYLTRLVKTELNLGSLIESTVKMMENEAEQQKDPLTIDEVLDDNDFLEFSELLEEEVLGDDREVGVN
jgi:hypothetical protein